MCIAFPQGSASTFDMCIESRNHWTKKRAKQDYREATITALKEAGKSDAEINRIVPPRSYSERLRNDVNTSAFVRLQEDVAFLKSEVKQLRAIIISSQANATRITGSQNSTRA